MSADTMLAPARGRLTLGARLRSMPLGLLALCAVLAVLTATPLVVTVVRSFLAPDGSFSLDGYRNVLLTSFESLQNTFVLGLGKTVLAVVIATVLAWLVVRTDLPGRRALELLIIVPFFIPQLISAMAWTLLGSERTGLINTAWREMTGLPDALVNINSMGGIIWHLMQYAVPFIFLLVTAGMRRMSNVYEEAARMCGASRWRTIFTISLPLLLPILSSAFLLSVIAGFEAFESPLILGQPVGIEVVTTEMYNSLYGRNIADSQTASAFAVVLVAAMSLLVLWQFRLLRGRSFATLSGKGSTPRRLSLGRWRWAAFAGVALWVVVTVVLPIGAIAYGTIVPFFGVYSTAFTFDHWETVLGDTAFFESLLRSLGIGLVSGSITVLLGLAIAYVSLRSQSRLKNAAAFLAWLPWLMPGIVLAVGLLWMFVSMPEAISLYQTLGAVVVAYIVIGLPLTTRLVHGGLSAVSVELEESARVHGASMLRALRTVVVPLIWPSFVTAWILMVVLALRELSASVLLYPSGHPTLSVYMLDLWTSGSLEDVSVVSFVVLAIVLLLLSMRAFTGRKIDQTML